MQGRICLHIRPLKLEFKYLNQQGSDKNAFNKAHNIYPELSANYRIMWMQSR